MPSEFIMKNSILYAGFRGEIGLSQLEANWAGLHNGNTGYLKKNTKFIVTLD